MLTFFALVALLALRALLALHALFPSFFPRLAVQQMR